MRHVEDIAELLDELEHCEADELEAQDLDFKEWSTRSMADMVDKVVEMAVCMANGGGGTVVFGVRDRVIGRSDAVLGVPVDIEVNKLKSAVYDRTEPKLTPVFEVLEVPEGTGRVLVMQVHGGLPPYTDTSGAGKIRVGKDCVPLTGPMRHKIAVERGERDYTATTIEGEVDKHVSPSALEQLRDSATEEGVADDFVSLSDRDLLDKLNLVEDGRLTRAGLLLCGRSESIRRHAPNYLWTYLKMRSDVDYSDRADGRDAIPVAINTITSRLMAHNPITTIEQGLFHFEYRQYPEIALREALLNALSHADFQVASPVLIKHFDDSIEITNPGGLIGGITDKNILHHAPVARNPRLVEALVALRLVNRSNLGVQRMYRALLQEGKEPPVIEDRGDVLRVTFRASEFSPAFRSFVAQEERAGHRLSVDHLLVLHYLMRHPEITTQNAARVCQRPEERAREVLSEMQLQFEQLGRGGTGRGTYWRLRPEIHERLEAHGSFDRDRRIDWETAKTRVLDVLKQRAENGEGLANREIRAISSFDRQQVTRLMAELREEGHARLEGHGAGAQWMFDRN